MAHRHDIQGLRAVAVLLVVLGHAGVPFLSGGYVGVDVFFVLSGFLITGLLLSEARRRGSISLPSFYARRARRILPAAALTLVVTTVAAYVLLNFVRARDTAVDSIWASVFAANIHFASDGSDYFAQAQPPSPVEHFWSLAVEEQFYLVWPGLLSLPLVLALRRRGRPGLPTTGTLLAVVGVVGVASLAWSIHSTETDPTSAYYSPFARGWELALGAALAVVAASGTRWLNTPILAALGWIGVAGIAASAATFSDTTPFPGYAALLPAVATALVLAAGVRAQPHLGVGRLLSVPPLRYIGDRSYAFYLWHWPVLVIAAEYVGHDLSLSANLLLLAGAFALSMLSYRFFENPIRRGRSFAARPLVVSPLTAAAALAVAAFTFHLTNGTAARYETAAAAVQPVAFAAPGSAPSARSKPLPAVAAAVRAAKQGAPLPSPLTPPVGSLRGDFYDFPDGCTPGRNETTSRVCRLGDTRSAKTMVVLGDSHAQMWMPTILRVAQKDSWQVVPLVKVGCIPDFWTNQRGRCAEWLRWAKREAAKLRPQVTLIIGSWAATQPTRPPVRGASALSAAAKRFSFKVIVVGDAPHQRRDPVDCLLARGATMRTCTTTATKADLQADGAIAAAARKRGIGFVDARGWFCARSGTRRTNYLCPLVVGQTITSADKGHMGRTYGLQLVQVFRAAVMRELLR